MDNSRTKLLIGEDGCDKLSKKHVTVVGVGGVGGYTTIFLARAGIKKFTLIDFDDVSPSNLNRQIMAFKSTIGQKKVEVMSKMLKDIDENIEVKVVPLRLTGENIKSIIGQTNIVVDAIDIVKDKVDLIVYCKQNNIDIISAMGAGNRYDYPTFKLTDIYSTSDDGLAKVIRKKLREQEVKSLDVVVSLSKGKKIAGVVGSISYYPAALGAYLASVVVNKFLEEKIWKL